MNVGNGNRRFMSDINVTPFVDVMLVLLIIFMVTAPMMIQGLDVSLPTATAEPLPSDEEPLIISIDKSSQIFISDFQVTAEFLREKLSAILKGRKDRTVYLKADKDVSYGTVVQVMSEIKGAGIEKLGMVTEPEVFEKKRNS
jgi:biopolymer transport protein TolR